MKNKELNNKLLAIDQSMREISGLDELYNELISKKPKTQIEEESYKEQAKFARERLLRLSLHVKHLLQKAEAHEKI